MPRKKSPVGRTAKKKPATRRAPKKKPAARRTPVTKPATHRKEAADVAQDPSGSLTATRPYTHYDAYRDLGGRLTLDELMRR